MKSKYYAVYDSKVEAYMNPFPMRTRGEAVRSWIDVVNDEKTQFAKHPEDFILMELAEFDPDTGKFTNNANGPVSVGVALEFVKKPAITDAIKPLNLA